MKSYCWLLFDADGTLFDYDQAETYALQQSFAQIDVPFDADCQATYRNINHQIWQDFEQGNITAERLKSKRFELLFEALSLKADARAFSERYLTNLSQATFLIQGAEETVRTLSEMYHIAMITNGLTKVQRPRFRESLLAPYIEATIISEEIGVAKPDPQIFDIAFEQMQHPTHDEVLIIGDSLTSDMQGGYNYGIDTCWFNPECLPNTTSITLTFEIQQIPELLNILGTGGIDESHN
jgi:YjjG family noncanonical pyrimidine nucleotidase